VPPERIVSLVPSLTELLHWLGCGDSLVGRTQFCTEPAEFVASVPAMGGTKNPSIERVVAARPDLVLANREENRREDIEALRAAGIEVLLTDPNTVTEAVTMIRELGQIFGESARAELLALETEAALAACRPLGVRVYAGVWHNPMMGLGGESYGSDLLERCGAINVLRERPRYPQVAFDEVAALSPELIILPDEPFPFGADHAAYYGQIAPVELIDGKLLWWYGPRMPEAIKALSALLARKGIP